MRDWEIIFIRTGSDTTLRDFLVKMALVAAGGFGCFFALQKIMPPDPAALIAVSAFSVLAVWIAHRDLG